MKAGRISASLSKVKIGEQELFTNLPSSGGGELTASKRASSSVKKANRSFSQIRGFKPVNSNAQNNDLQKIENVNEITAIPEMKESEASRKEIESGDFVPEMSSMIFPMNFSHRLKPQGKQRKNPKQQISQEQTSSNQQAQTSNIPPLILQNYLQYEFVNSFKKQQPNTQRVTSTKQSFLKDTQDPSEEAEGDDKNVYPMSARDTTSDLQQSSYQKRTFSKFNSQVQRPAILAPNSQNPQEQQSRRTPIKITQRMTPSQVSPFTKYEQPPQQQQLQQQQLNSAQSNSQNKLIFSCEKMDNLNNTTQFVQKSFRSVSVTRSSSQKRRPSFKKDSFLPPLLEIQSAEKGVAHLSSDNQQNLQGTSNFSTKFQSENKPQDKENSAVIEEENFIPSDSLQNLKCQFNKKNSNLNNTPLEKSNKGKSHQIEELLSNIAPKTNILEDNTNTQKQPSTKRNWERSGGTLVKSFSVSKGTYLNDEGKRLSPNAKEKSIVNLNMSHIISGEAQQLVNNLMNKAPKTHSLYSLVKKSGISQSKEPKVLSPANLKNQKVFHVPSGHSNSKSANSSCRNLNNPNNANPNSQPALNFSLSSKQVIPVSNTNNSDSQYQFYPPINERKKSNPQLNCTYNNSQTQSNFGVLDDSVEEYLEYNTIPPIEPSKISQKGIGIVSAFAANTHMGIARNYNEDRVSIILNIAKPEGKQTQMNWPNASFFGIYDGHAGNACAEYLKDNLHHYVYYQQEIIKNEHFPEDPKKAIESGFAAIEKDFLDRAIKFSPLDKSGSCAIIAFVIGNKIYIGNVGDSRAILSSNQGLTQRDLSEDHKPNLPSEERRIKSFGGHIYQSIVPAYTHKNYQGGQVEQIVEYIKGPPRAFPGRLAVSRTIGDAEAKLSQFGGMKGVISPEPEIQMIEVEEQDDFILLACDGIFDKLSSKEAIQICWASGDSYENPHEFAGKSIEGLLRVSMAKKSYDNVTGVIIGLKNLQNYCSSLKIKNVDQK